eukprot:CAMPEP_0198728502 /NCGR_PEP_ID=MMETSP1475-20131203/9902_1 /TAXON_ID= ORGANISM="Unidentified sp., Strain CCMP1999" /NCGR_SAMPLE_ID=MMETSP1475 /ASSEMBLY_ACC=CAM_ASM_001111 /LENGTH=55 /DNA_ID=CAMNT_0044490901 /DNA_START=155 /DNA_END=322 /DNA_ORIENTATION=-
MSSSANETLLGHFSTTGGVFMSATASVTTFRLCSVVRTGLVAASHLGLSSSGLRL